MKRKYTKKELRTGFLLSDNDAKGMGITILALLGFAAIFYVILPNSGFSEICILLAAFIGVLVMGLSLEGTKAFWIYQGKIIITNRKKVELELLIDDLKIIQLITHHYTSKGFGDVYSIDIEFIDRYGKVFYRENGSEYSLVKSLVELTMEFPELQDKITISSDKCPYQKKFIEKYEAERIAIKQEEKSKREYLDLEKYGHCFKDRRIEDAFSSIFGDVSLWLNETSAYIVQYREVKEEVLIEKITKIELETTESQERGKIYIPQNVNVKFKKDNDIEFYTEEGESVELIKELTALLIKYPSLIEKVVLQDNQCRLQELFWETVKANLLRATTDSDLE